MLYRDAQDTGQSLVITRTGLEESRSWLKAIAAVVTDVGAVCGVVAERRTRVGRADVVVDKTVLAITTLLALADEGRHVNGVLVGPIHSQRAEGDFRPGLTLSRSVDRVYRGMATERVGSIRLDAGGSEQTRECLDKGNS